MAIKVKSGETIIFIGDSITDCGRRDIERPLGNGYVKFFSDILSIREPGKKINIINKGIDGDIVTGLRDRWSDDVICNKPDWLSIKIGINDLHGHLQQKKNGVTPEIYEQAYDDILSRTVEKYSKCKILLIDPFYISLEQSQSSFRKEVLDIIGTYIQTVHSMSKKYNTLLVKTHDLFQEQLNYNNAEVFCSEPVHPYSIGHLLIAEAVYEVLSS
jgi:lysophospholipase L1-like esterase